MSFASVPCFLGVLFNPIRALAAGVAQIVSSHFWESRWYRAINFEHSTRVSIVLAFFFCFVQ
jgi:hypothetical protein